MKFQKSFRPKWVLISIVAFASVLEAQQAYDTPYANQPQVVPSDNFAAPVNRTINDRWNDEGQVSVPSEGQVEFPAEGQVAFSPDGQVEGYSSNNSFSYPYSWVPGYAGTVDLPYATTLDEQAAMQQQAIDDQIARQQAEQERIELQQIQAEQLEMQQAQLQEAQEQIRQLQDVQIREAEARQLQEAEAQQQELQAAQAQIRLLREQRAQAEQEPAVEASPTLRLPSASTSPEPEPQSAAPAGDQNPGQSGSAATVGR